MTCDIHRDLHEVTVHNNNLGYSRITVIKILNDFIYKENVAEFIPRFTSRILYFFRNMYSEKSSTVTIIYFLSHRPLGHFWVPKALILKLG